MIHLVRISASFLGRKAKAVLFELDSRLRLTQDPAILHPSKAETLNKEMGKSNVHFGHQ